MKTVLALRDPRLKSLNIVSEKKDSCKYSQGLSRIQGTLSNRTNLIGRKMKGIHHW